MPWKANSGNIYKLCLLDTNAISEILKYPMNEGIGFTTKYPPSEYAPCFSIYNLLELRRNEEVYTKFLSMFSIYSIFLLKPYKMIFDDEINNYESKSAISPLYNAFTPLGKDDSYNLRLFIDILFSSDQFSTIETDWRKDEEITLQSWIENKHFYKPINKFPNALEADIYINKAWPQYITLMNNEFYKNLINKNIFPNIDQFPSIKTMLYSIYYRLYNPSWVPTPSEVTDVKITAVTPYLDVFITEKFQENIITKIKYKVKGLNSLTTVRLKDIRV